MHISIVIEMVLFYLNYKQNNTLLRSDILYMIYDDDDEEEDDEFVYGVPVDIFLTSLN